MTGDLEFPVIPLHQVRCYGGRYLDADPAVKVFLNCSFFTLLSHDHSIAAIACVFSNP